MVCLPLWKGILLFPPLYLVVCFLQNSRTILLLFLHLPDYPRDWVELTNIITGGEVKEGRLQLSGKLHAQPLELVAVFINLVAYTNLDSGLTQNSTKPSPVLDQNNADN